MGKLDGITYLVAVTQMKASNANDDALHGAEDQRELVKKQQTLRQAQQRFEELARDKKFDANDQAAMSNIYQALNTDKVTEQPLNWGSYAGKFKGDGTAEKLDDTNQKFNNDLIEGIRKDLDNAMKGLEGQDRMGNFEIQRLMSAFNQAETLSSNMQKKADDTVSGQQQKIG